MLACAEITSEEATIIAHRIQEQILDRMPMEGRVELDLSVTTEPDDGTFYREEDEVENNYSVPAIWLEKFVAFCHDSDGFRVI